jgi:hypothetical protein
VLLTFSKEPGECDYTVIDGVMPDIRDYEAFIVAVWRLEAARDTGRDTEAMLHMLDRAAALNAKATAVIFPRLASDGWNHAPRSK